ncbi:uncharacterized protein TNCT_208121 [Trichonephila clavata]|uniref:Uncharacterized protein n=1 Tax=Trichonephila clavata TaxID=2740835 RepID=A0A8X6J4V7_TRICU|nr:uncharacterized protein TNCT_208121 [Trichonephila clavata]
MNVVCINCDQTQSETCSSKQLVDTKLHQITNVSKHQFFNAPFDVNMRIVQVFQLEPRFLENVWDIIKDPENTAKYSTVKDRLLLTFQESENVRIERLLTGLELGDMLPSQLLRKMGSLGHPDISEKVLRTLWLEKIPESVRNIIIVSDEGLEKLVAMADKIVEMSPRTLELSAVIKDTSEIEHLLSKISALEAQLASI